MSRLGDLIKLERTRQNMTYKQVARMCGVSEKFLMDVEMGTRIIADDQARRILKTIGMKSQTEADFTLDDIASTVDLQTVAPRVARPEPKEAPASDTRAAASSAPVEGSVWLDALSSMLKRVPVMNAAMKETGHRLVPVENGRIEGASPDKVFYYLAPDNACAGFRVRRGDRVLVVPASSPVDGALMLLRMNDAYVLRKIKRLEGFQVLLQRFDGECESELRTVSELSCVGRCVRLEADL